MKNKKKLIAIILAALVVISGVAAGIFIFVLGGDDEPTLQEIIENRVTAYETDFKDSIEQMDDQASVTKYLVNWGENKGIDVTTDQNGNVVYSFKADEGLENRVPTVILCGYDYSCIEYYTNSIVCALTIAKNENQHGEYKIIFVSEEDGNKDVADKLSKEYFKDDAEVFYLGSDYTSNIAATTGGFAEYKFTENIDTVNTSYNKAYKITLSGLTAQNINSKTVSAPNPIKQLGSLLANFKSKSVLFDLVEFNGGSEANSTPTEASITIVVSEDATEKVENRLNSAIENFTEKYGKKYPDAVYSFEVVNMPSKVIDSDDTESLISLLYTVPNGVYFKDDDDNVTSFTCIKSINTNDGTINLSVAASSYDEATLTEISDAYQTICVLTDMAFEQTASFPIYKMNEAGTALSEVFTASYDEYKSNDLDVKNAPEYSMCSSLIAKHPDMKLVALGVSRKTTDNFAGGFMVHMSR